MCACRHPGTRPKAPGMHAGHGIHGRAQTFAGGGYMPCHLLTRGQRQEACAQQGASGPTHDCGNRDHRMMGFAQRPSAGAREMIPRSASNWMGAALGMATGSAWKRGGGGFASLLILRRWPAWWRECIAGALRRKLMQPLATESSLPIDSDE